eukprot:Em0023g441a
MRLPVFAILLLLLLLGEASTGTVPQCSILPGLGQVAYSIASNTKRVCLLSEVNLFAKLISRPIGNVTTTPGTTAACVYNNTSIYVNQNALTGSGTVAFQDSSGTSFELVYAPRGIYNTNKTVIRVAAGDPEPVESLWLSYGISSWLLCELVDGAQLRQPSFNIIAFDDAPDCLVASDITTSTNVRAIRLVFNSSLVPIGSHPIVAIDRSYGVCDGVAPPPSLLPVMLIVSTTTDNNNTSAGTPSGNVTVIKSNSTIPLVIGIPVAFTLVIVVVVVVSGMILAVRRRTCTRKQKVKDRVKPVKPVKPVNGSFNSLNLNNFENDVGVKLPQSMEVGSQGAQTGITVVVDKKDSRWIPLLSAKLGSLHNCNYNVVESKDFDPAQLEDQRCQCTYAVWSAADEGGGASTDFIQRLSPHVANDKLLMAHFGLDAQDSDIDGNTDKLPVVSYIPIQLGVETAEECAVRMHSLHAGNIQPRPLSIPVHGNVLDDRSLSTTPPSSATCLLEDSGASSFTNSDQSTPDVQHMQHRCTKKFPKDQQSLLIEALLRTQDQVKELVLNTDFLVEAKQKESHDGAESLPPP